MDKLKVAVEATFKRRRTALIKNPIIFQDDFIKDKSRQTR